MYNKERKEMYISEYRNTNIHVDANLRPKLNAVSTYEESIGKDICEFTIGEITDYYKFLCTPSLEYLMSITSWFSNYTQWCLSKNLVPDCQNHYLELSSEMLLACVNKGLANSRVISRDELIKQLDTLENPSDQFMMLALFEGICGKNYSELFYAKQDQIYGDTMFLCSGRELKISNKLKTYAEEAANEYTYYCFVHNTDGVIRNNERKLDPNDDAIIKKMYNSSSDPSETAMFQRMHNRTDRLKKHFGAECFRSKALLESGRIDMINQLMENGSYGSIYECIVANKDVIYYRYGSLTSIPRYIAKYKDFLKE